MSGIDGTALQLDAGAVFVSARFKPDSTPSTETSAIRPIITIAAVSDIVHDDLRIGFAASLPYVEGGNWPRDGGAAPVSRYYLVDGAVFHIETAMSLSYRPLRWLALGASFKLTYGQHDTELDKDLGIILNQTVGSETLGSPFPYAHPDLAAQTLVHASGWGVGATLGVLLTPFEELSFGIALHSPVAITGRGDVTVNYPARILEFIDETLPGAMPPDIGGDVSMNLDLPLCLYAGASARPHRRWEIAADYRFCQKSTSPTLNVQITEATSPSVEDTTVVRGFLDQHVWTLRGGYQIADELGAALVFRYLRNTVPEASFSPNNIDFDRFELGGLARWHLSEQWAISLQYSYFPILSRTIHSSLHRPLTQPSLATYNHPSPTGRASAAAHAIQIGVRTDL